MSLEIRIIPARCTCGQRLGKHQSYIEEQIRLGKNISTICDDLGLIKMCCRSDTYNPRIQMVNDSNCSRIIDEVSNKNPLVATGNRRGANKEESSATQRNPVVTAGPVVIFRGISKST